MILNDNSTQQINTLVIQLQNKITNLNNEFRKLNNNIDDLNSEISDLEKRISSNENDADNNIGDLDSKISDLEKRVSSNENNAAAMNTEILANTEAISGKADKNHTHTKSQITDFDHTHDDRYYTESEVDTKLSGKADKIHTHTKSEITDFPTSLPANGGTATTAESANKIEPNYTANVELSAVTSETIKYIKIADCTWVQEGILQVYLDGVNFLDTLIINFGGGNALHPTLCGCYTGNSHEVYSVIARKGSTWNSGYSIYVKMNQLEDCNVSVALLKGSCTINITESTTAPTNISEWAVDYGLFGDITAPVITSLEQRVAALESKI